MPKSSSSYSRSVQRERRHSRSPSRDRERYKYQTSSRSPSRTKDSEYSSSSRRRKVHSSRRSRSKSPRPRGDKTLSKPKKKKYKKKYRRESSTSSSSSNTSVSSESNNSRKTNNFPVGKNKSVAVNQLDTSNLKILDGQINQNVIDKIDEDFFLSQAYSSSASTKKIPEKVIINLNSETVRVDTVEQNNITTVETIFHPKFLGDELKKTEKWVNKLYNYRRRIND